MTRISKLTVILMIFFTIKSIKSLNSEKVELDRNKYAFEVTY